MVHDTALRGPLHLRKHHEGRDPFTIHPVEVVTEEGWSLEDPGPILNWLLGFGDAFSFAIEARKIMASGEDYKAEAHILAKWITRVAEFSEVMEVLKVWLDIPRMRGIEDSRLAEVSPEGEKAELLRMAHEWNPPSEPWPSWWFEEE